MTKYNETHDTKPKQKRKKVVQVVTAGGEEGTKSDEDITELIKESVKEALHKSPERSAQTSHGQRQPLFQEPL